MNQFPMNHQGTLVDAYIAGYIRRDNATDSLVLELKNALREDQGPGSSKQSGLESLGSELESYDAYYFKVCVATNLINDPLYAKAIESTVLLHQIIWGKVHRILVSSGKDLVLENPAYVRSYHFNTDSFVRLCVLRSLANSKTWDKWMRLRDTLGVIISRLRLLYMTSICIRELTSSDFKGAKCENELIDEIDRGDQEMGKVSRQLTKR